jgi:hypothetical protein
MLWSPSSFEGWGKRGVQRILHQFSQRLLHSTSAADAAHRNAPSIPRTKATRFYGADDKKTGIRGYRVLGYMKYAIGGEG